MASVRRRTRELVLAEVWQFQRNMTGRPAGGIPGNSGDLMTLSTDLQIELETVGGITEGD